MTEFEDYLKTRNPKLRGFGRRQIYNMVEFYDTYSSREFADIFKRLRLWEFVQSAIAQLPDGQIVQPAAAQMDGGEIVQSPTAQMENRSAVIVQQEEKIMQPVSFARHEQNSPVACARGNLEK